jgi:hypothetical protein
VADTKPFACAMLNAVNAGRRRRCLKQCMHCKTWQAIQKVKR